MEDQQPDSGDLTTDTTKEAAATEGTAVDTVDVEEPARRSGRWRFWRRSKAAEPEPVEPEATEPEASEEAKPEPPKPVGKKRRATKVVAPVDEPEQVAEEPAAEEAADSEPAVLVPHEPAGKRLKIAAAVAAALFVAAGAFAGAMLQPYLADRALVHIKFDIARTAAAAITTLWTYTPDDMETLPDRSAKFLGGDFAAEYRRYIDAIVATNKQVQVSNDTQVLGTAVESVTPAEATAIVYTNSVATSPVSKNIPSLRYLSYRLTMERHNADWLITRMTAITQLDLTPKL